VVHGDRVDIIHAHADGGPLVFGRADG